MVTPKSTYAPYDSVEKMYEAAIQATVKNHMIRSIALSSFNNENVFDLLLTIYSSAQQRNEFLRDCVDLVLVFDECFCSIYAPNIRRQDFISPFFSTTFKRKISYKTRYIRLLRDRIGNETMQPICLCFNNGIGHALKKGGKNKYIHCRKDIPDILSHSCKNHMIRQAITLHL